MSEAQYVPGSVLPNSQDAEKSVLGAVIQSESAMITAAEELTPADFFNPAHQIIFEAAMNLHKQGMAVDVATVTAELDRMEKRLAAGDVEYLVNLAIFVPTTANVRTYIRIVQENAVLRALALAGKDIHHMAVTREDDLQTILNKSEKAVFDIVMRRNGNQTLRPLSEVMVDAHAIIEEYDRLKGKISGVPTGFYELDRLLTGLHPGELVLIGARPSMGKTSFAINIATYAALHGKKTAIFSLEMPREQIAIRMLCCDARVDMQHVRQGVLKDDEWIKLSDSIGPLCATDVYIDDSAGLTPTQLRSRCRRLMMEHGLDLIIIDYLQLMATDERADNRQQEVSAISRSLKAIALELKVPLIACAQLSRANTHREDKRPVLSDLRESGSIEQDADVVMFLHRDTYYGDPQNGGDMPPEVANLAEIIVAKQRNGPLGKVKVAWRGEYTRFENLSTAIPPQ